MSKFANRTTVPIEKSLQEIQSILRRHDGTGSGYYSRSLALSTKSFTHVLGSHLHVTD
ncbi:hypothetical protein MYX76_04420 [Desulfobacterota bacterium AH_259_B03_O07]|nr:hypothetical protein [Desulfobacterota bacterium AH_259_B03_O07]